VTVFREFLSGSPHLAGPVAALVLFFAVFLGVLFFLVRGMVRRRSFDDVASLPLEEENRPTPTQGGFIR
jgi:hypothetical protein